LRECNVDPSSPTFDGTTIYSATQALHAIVRLRPTDRIVLTQSIRVSPNSTLFIDGGKGTFVLGAFRFEVPAGARLCLHNAVLRDSTQGAMLVDGGRANVSHCTVVGNANSGDGGGFLLVNGGTAVVAMSNVWNNSATSGSGGAFAVVSAFLQLLDCNVMFNNARRGGGLAAADDSSVVIVATSIEQNTATDSGGGLEVAGVCACACERGRVHACG
jgi:hypothetical protein